MDRGNSGGYQRKDSEQRRPYGATYGQKPTQSFTESFAPLRQEREQSSSAISAAAEEEAPKLETQRPKLNLIPRTLPVDDSLNAPVSANASIFGSAKPVNTAARLKEIEEKLIEREKMAAVEKKEKAADTETSAPEEAESELRPSTRVHKTSNTSDDNHQNASSLHVDAEFSKSLKSRL